MIRLTVLSLLVAGLCVYAWRDWFVSLCGLVLLTTFTQHHDMPRMMMGIPGLNPWNIVLVVVICVRCMQHSRNPWRPPFLVSGLLIAYVLLLVLGALVAVVDVDTLAARGWPVRSTTTLVMDLILNPVKYLAVGVLMYDGARSRRNMWMGVGTIVLYGVLHSLMMYKTMKGVVFYGDYEDARRMTDKMIGLHANDLAALLTMTLWSAIFLATMLKGKWRWVWGLVAVVVVPTIVGCHSRTAYVAVVAVAVVLGIVRWRKLLVVLPVGVIVAIALFPQIGMRLGMGFGEGHGATDWNEVTAGRTDNLWGPTMDQIVESPLIGHGRLAIGRTACYEEILAREGTVPTHPHNSYLEVLLDFGLVGLLVVTGLFLTIGWAAYQMMRCRNDVLVTVVGAVGFVGIVHVLALGLSSNYFYPKQSMMWLLCSSGLTIRMWTVRNARVSRPIPFLHRGLPRSEYYGPQVR